MLGIEGLKAASVLFYFAIFRRVSPGSKKRRSPAREDTNYHSNLEPITPDIVPDIISYQSVRTKDVLV